MILNYRSGASKRQVGRGAANLLPKVRPVTRALLLILALLLVLGLAAGPAVPAEPPTATGGAFALKVIVPGQPGASVAEIGGPATTTGGADAFAYPADGSVVRIGPAATSITVRAGAEPSVQAAADVVAVSIFNGEITADSVNLRAAAGIGAKGGTAGGEGSSVGNVVALGQAIAATPGAGAALADWGSVTVLPAGAERTRRRRRSRGTPTSSDCASCSPRRTAACLQEARSSSARSMPPPRLLRLLRLLRARRRPRRPSRSRSRRSGP